MGKKINHGEEFPEPSEEKDRPISIKRGDGKKVGWRGESINLQRK